MLKKETVEQRTEALLLPILEKAGAELVDVEYGKEGSDRILRIAIDKQGGVRIDDCELVSRALSDALDQADFLEEAYMLEVSSPGLLRPIKKDRDFERNLGKEVELHLYKPQDGGKDWVGTLKAYDKEQVILELDQKEHCFARNAIALLRPYIDFSEL